MKSVLGDLFTPGHIILIVIIALLLFGPTKLPELGRAFGKTLREFKAGVRGAVSDEEPQEQTKPLPAAEKTETHAQ